MRKVTVKPDKSWRAAWWILGLAVLVLALAIRIRLLGIPVERDEGEYADAGQLMLQGIPPSKLAYNMKFRGTYVAYDVPPSTHDQSNSSGNTTHSATAGDGGALLLLNQPNRCASRCPFASGSLLTSL